MARLDPNLRLAIISALCLQGLVDYVDYKIIEIKPQLNKITKLSWGPDNDLIVEIAPDWDGEDDKFDINDLSGIEELQNLQSLSIEWLLVDNPRNRTIIQQLEQRGVTVRINGKPGWPVKKKVAQPLPVQPTPPIDFGFPPVKKELTLAPLAVDQLQIKLDQLIGKVFAIPISPPVHTKEPLSLGGFKAVAEAQGSKENATYLSIVTKIYWNEQELHEVSFYARYMKGWQCLTMTGSIQNSDQLATLLVEANDIDPKIISQLALH